MNIKRPNNSSIEKRIVTNLMWAGIATIGICALRLAMPVSASVPETLSVTGSTLDSARVYPNPWRSDQHSGQVTFDQMPTLTTIKIFNIAGEFVKTLDADAGTANWDLTNDAGDKVASGLYLYVLLTDDGQEFKGKLAVIR